MVQRLPSGTCQLIYLALFSLSLFFLFYFLKEESSVRGLQILGKTDSTRVHKFTLRSRDLQSRNPFRHLVCPCPFFFGSKINVDIPLSRLNHGPWTMDHKPYQYTLLDVYEVTFCTANLSANTQTRACWKERSNTCDRWWIYLHLTRRPA